jgi:hypothetical protein
MMARNKFIVEARRTEAYNDSDHHMISVDLNHVGVGND